ncbi:hypothetical protein PG993_010460 [Apiospora rasikravindrae]|uniref:3CxxC-type domain-containing protein n=1 Tax=Apiospora rasikravindrae TaxID=990691 RepID=A0ABR1SP42_9PEZI
MANGIKSSSTSGIETRESFMFPWLHKRVSNAVREQINPLVFHNKGRASEDYETYVMGKFICNNGSCGKNAWTSKKVGVVIRHFADDGHGMGYNATIFNQRCKACNTLGTFSLDQKSYIERVAYRLRVWAGVPQERAPYKLDENNKPHRADLCEGCKSGHCERKRPGNYYMGEGF